MFLKNRCKERSDVYLTMNSTHPLIEDVGKILC